MKRFCEAVIGEWLCILLHDGRYHLGQKVSLDTLVLEDGRRFAVKGDVASEVKPERGAK